jgi:hypothetical protein
MDIWKIINSFHSPLAILVNLNADLKEPPDELVKFQRNPDRGWI